MLAHSKMLIKMGFRQNVNECKPIMMTQEYWAIKAIYAI